MKTIFYIGSSFPAERHIVTFGNSSRGLGGYAPYVVVVLSNVFIMLSMLSDAMRTDESRVYSRIRG